MPYYTCEMVQAIHIIRVRSLKYKIFHLTFKEQPISLIAMSGLGLNWLFRVWRGVVGREMGETADAIAFLVNAVETNPDNVNALYQLGESFADLGDFEQAEKCFRAAVERAPDVPGYRGKLASCLGQLGRVSEAVAEFEAALGASPDDPALLGGLAWLKAENGDLGEARRFDVPVRVR